VPVSQPQERNEVEVEVRDSSFKTSGALSLLLKIVVLGGGDPF